MALLQAVKTKKKKGTRMDSCLLDVLHDTADGDVALLVAQGIHIQLICSVHVLVNQHWPVRIHLYGVLYVPLEVCLTVTQPTTMSVQLMHSLCWLL